MSYIRRTVLGNLSPARMKTLTRCGTTLLAVIVLCMGTCPLSHGADDEAAPSVGYSQVELPQVKAGAVMALALHPDGRKVVAGFRDGTIAVWDVARRELLLTQRIGHTPVSFVGFGSGDGEELVVAVNNMLKVVSFNGPGLNQRVVRRVTGFRVWQSPDGTKLALAPNLPPYYVSVLDTQDWTTIKRIPLTAYPQQASVDNRGRYVAVTYIDAIVTHRTTDGEIQSRFDSDDDPDEPAFILGNMCFIGNSTRLLVGLDYDLLVYFSIVDVRQGILVRHGVPCISPLRFTVSQCGQWLVEATDDATFVRDVPALKQRAKIPQPSQAERTSAFISRGGTLVGVGGMDGSVRLWATQEDLNKF